ncbi:MAG: penicillin-binding transpeptidase domain-containing protein, partial [Candidatus Gracilibacteria bacterium]|nr:penicillin-binding transpeptidase domain-containing protein [Candidatus Gracilibacteria bacterium]
ALWVAEKMGRTLFHKYILDFGFSDFTGIELNENESRGWVKRPANWANIDLASAGFGQGLAVTPLQMAVAGSALANDGKLMRPHVIAKVVDSETGEEKITQPTIVDTPISMETADKIKAMMISAVQNGFAKTGDVDHYFIAAKTGTSQIAKDDGTGYEEGPGSTYATYFGFAPSNDPKYAILVKVDRPLRDQWGTNVAGPLFGDIMEFILQYYGVQWEY